MHVVLRPRVQGAAEHVGRALRVVGAIMADVEIRRHLQCRVAGGDRALPIDARHIAVRFAPDDAVRSTYFRMRGARLAVDADFLYVARFWVSPDGATEVLRWLDSHHMADDVAESGFRWMRRVRLEQDAVDGWYAYVMIYGLGSRQALHRYFDGPRRRDSRRSAKLSITTSA